MNNEKIKEQKVIVEVTITEINDALKTNMTSILGNIRRVMAEKGVNQKELSLRIGSEESHVSKMLKKEAYKNGLTIKVLGRICKGLQVNLTEIIK